MYLFLKIIGFIVFGQFTILATDYSFAQSVESESDRPKNVNHIGVLAFRGVGAAISRWQSLAVYLTDSIDGQEFKLTPVTLVSAYQQIENKSIDFIITNPGHYVVLAEQFGLNAMSTRERLSKGGKKGLLEYGSAIIVRNESDLKAINGLKGKTIAAVSPDAFGGFQIAWKEMEAQGIDVFTDLESIRYMGFPQDDIVSAVLNKEVDAGIVRSGLLELLAEERRLKTDELRVLNANSLIDYPYQISSKLYPEWPFASLPGVSKSLREKVLISLLNTQNTEISSMYKLHDIWSVPLSYSEVRNLMTSYQKRLFQSDQQEPLIPGSEYIYIVLIVFGVLAIFGVFGVFAFYRPGTKLPELKGTQITGTEEPDMVAARRKFDILTPREREILVLICCGDQNKIIAKKLNISPKTVEFHRTNLLHKTEAGTTAHLVQLATRLGLDQGVSLG